MQDIFEVFSGSTVDASFVKQHLEANGIGTIVKNKHDESIMAGWADPNAIIGTQVFVSGSQEPPPLLQTLVALRSSCFAWCFAFLASTWATTSAPCAPHLLYPGIVFVDVNGSKGEEYHYHRRFQHSA